ncbi:Protein HupE [Gammaproteobacteria bacterium]
MKKIFNHFLWTLGAIVFIPMLAFAHTGVGETTGFSSGFIHPMGGVDHLLAMVAVGLWAAQMGGRAILVVPGTFITLMIVGALVAILDIPAIYVEEGIIGSVLILGVLIAAAFKFSIVTSACIVGVFALFHGYSHGTEMPLTIGMFSYSIGFASSTALLHTVGIIIGLITQKMNIARSVRFVGGGIALVGVYLAVA